MESSDRLSCTPQRCNRRYRVPCNSEAEAPSRTSDVVRVHANRGNDRSRSQTAGALAREGVAHLGGSIRAPEGVPGGGIRTPGHRPHATLDTACCARPEPRFCSTPLYKAKTLHAGHRPRGDRSDHVPPHPSRAGRGREQRRSPVPSTPLIHGRAPWIRAYAKGEATDSRAVSSSLVLHTAAV